MVCYRTVNTYCLILLRNLFDESCHNSTSYRDYNSLHAYSFSQAASKEDEENICSINNIFYFYSNNFCFAVFYHSACYRAV